MDDFVWRHVHLTQLYSERLGNVFRLDKLQRQSGRCSFFAGMAHQREGSRVGPGVNFGTIGEKMGMVGFSSRLPAHNPN